MITVHVLVPYNDLGWFLDRYGLEKMEYASNPRNAMHFMTIETTEEDFLILKIKYGAKAWKR